MKGGVKRNCDSHRASLAIEKKRFDIIIMQNFIILLTLTEVLFTAFSVDFHNKRG